MSYERIYGKPIEPRKFKKEILGNLGSAVKNAQQKAKRYLEKADVEVDSCYICGSKQKNEVIAQVYGFQYVRCLNCTHVYQTKRLSQDALVKLYENDSTYAHTYTDQSQTEYRLQNIARPKADFVMKYAGKAQGKWLDVGCGIGDLVSYVNHQRWSAIGIDVSKDCVETGRKEFNIDIRLQTIKQFADENPNVKFDVVSTMGHLDLTPEPIKDLTIAYELLNENGIIACELPNHESISSLVQKSFPDLSVRHLEPPFTIQQFTIKSAETAFRLTGFTPIAIWYFGLDFYEMLNALCLVVERFQASALYEFLMNNLNDFQKVIDEKELSDGFILIGKKES